MKITDIIIVTLMILLIGLALENDTSVSYQAGRLIHRAQVEFYKGYFSENKTIPNLEEMKK